MKVVMLGAGNVATHLSRVLQTKGFTIAQIFSKTRESAKTLSDALHASYTNQIEDIYPNADIYIYAVNDSVLESLSAQINIPNAIHIHTAGSIPIAIFEGKALGYGVIYPLQTFSKEKEVDFDNVPLFVEGNSPETTALLKEIAGKLSSQCYNITSVQREKLHLAGVFASNFVNYMYTVSEKLLKEANLPFDIIKPLIVETAAKIQTMSPRDAQTGPAVRYDTNIIDKHLEILNTHPELRKIYKEISQQIFITATKDKK